MKKLKLLPFSLTVILGLCLLLTACSGGAPEEERPGPPQPEGGAVETKLIQPAYRVVVMDLPAELGRPRRMAAGGDTLYLLGTGGVFASADGGDTWSATEVTAPENVTAMAAGDGSIYFISSVYQDDTMRLSACACDGESGETLASWDLDGLDGAWSVNCALYGGALAVSAGDSAAVYLWSPEGELLRQAELPGPVLFLAGTPDALLACYEGPDGGKVISALDPETGETEELCAVDSQETPAGSYVSENGIYWASDGGLYSVDPDTAESVKLFSWSDVGTAAPESFFCAANGDILLADNFAGVVCRISRYDGPPLKELVIGVGGGGATYLTRAVNVYNSSSTEYYIREERYGAEDAERVLTEINAGRGPDILALGDTRDEFNAMNRVSVKSGMLEDLLPYIDADPTLSREDFLPGMLESMTENGGVYRLAPGFNLNTVTAPEKIAGSLESWDMDALFRLKDETPEDMSLFRVFDRDSFMRELCGFASVEFVDYDSGTCRFGDPAFGRWLELIEDLRFEEDVPSGDYMLACGNTRPTDAAGFLSGGDGYEYLGYPGREGACSYLTSSTGGFSILTSSPNKEAAWEFIRLLLTPQLQQAICGPGFGLPVTEASFDTAAEDWLEQYGDKGYSRADIDKFKAAVAANNGMARGDTVSDMITEEAERYFAGQKSLEDTVRLLQSRANIYLAETR